LQEAGLVGYDPNGRRNIFHLKPAGFRDARIYLDLFWDEALANFKRLAEETAETEL
jgi:hypothetical protein